MARTSHAVSRKDAVYYFLVEDYRRLGDKILEIMEQFKHIARDMGESCEEGAETFHDNFGWEDGDRQLRALSSRLRELVHIKDNARVVTPEPKGEIVGMGRTVQMLDHHSGKERTFRVGSYMALGGTGDSISYQAPLARILIGARVGDVRQGKIAGRPRQLEVLDVR